jgi:hypothetical protein
MNLQHVHQFGNFSLWSATLINIASSHIGISRRKMLKSGFAKTRHFSEIQTLQKYEGKGLKL